MAEETQNTEQTPAPTDAPQQAAPAAAEAAAAPDQQQSAAPHQQDRGGQRGGGGGGRGGRGGQGGGRGRGPGGRGGRDRDRDESGMESSVVRIYRCSKVVKGGRTFSFGALVVAGDRKGNIGIGYGKANEVPPAVEKATKDARKQMFKINLKGGTVPHTVKGRSPLNVAISKDGVAWEAALVLESDPGEYSYPAVIQTRDGKVHITYTWRRERIKHVIVDPARLHPRTMVDGRWPD